MDCSVIRDKGVDDNVNQKEEGRDSQCGKGIVQIPAFPVVHPVGKTEKDEIEDNKKGTEIGQCIKGTGKNRNRIVGIKPLVAIAEDSGKVRNGKIGLVGDVFGRISADGRKKKMAPATAVTEKGKPIGQKEPAEEPTPGVEGIPGRDRKGKGKTKADQIERDVRRRKFRFFFRRKRKRASPKRSHALKIAR